MRLFSRKYPLAQRRESSDHEAGLAGDCGGGGLAEATADVGGCASQSSVASRSTTRSSNPAKKLANHRVTWNAASDSVVCCGTTSATRPERGADSFKEQES